MEAETRLASVTEERVEHWRRTLGFFAGPVIFALVWFLPHVSLDARPRHLAAIVSLVVVWWVSEPIPLPATALIGAALMVMTGVTNAQAAFAPFASPTIFLFIGSFIIAEALTVHGLDRRVAVRLLALPWVGRSPSRIRLVFGALAAGLSMWLSNTATAAMLLPVALGLLRAQSAARSSPAAKGLLLILAYSSSIGGTATPVGTPPNLIAIGMLESLAGEPVDFFRWMAVGVPVMMLMYGTLIAVTHLLYPIATARLDAAAEERTLSAPPRTAWGAAERNCVIVFTAAVSLWITPGIVAVGWGTASAAYKLATARLDEGTVAIAAATLLFLLPVNWRRREFTLTWAQAARIDWGTILLFGGGLALGQQMFETGLAAQVGRWFVRATGANSLWTIAAAMTVAAKVLTEFTSNTATTNMLVPVAIAVARAAGVSPVPPAMGVAFGAGLAYMLPISTPPNAIVYGTGRVPITDMIKCGVVLDVLSVGVVGLGLRVLCPLVGLV